MFLFFFQNQSEKTSPGVLFSHCHLSHKTLRVPFSHCREFSFPGKALVVGGETLVAVIESKLLALAKPYCGRRSPIVVPNKGSDEPPNETLL